MGLLNKTAYEARVSFSGVEAYAHSELEEAVMHAVVEAPASTDEALGTESIDPLALLIPLAASRLIDLARMTPGTGPAMMATIEVCADHVLDSKEEQARKFRCRDLVETDPERLASRAMFTGPEGMAEAQVQSALPEVVDQLDGGAERTIRWRLLRGRRGGFPWASVKASARGAPVVSTASLFALLEFCARLRSFERATLPAAAGLRALHGIWEEVGSPTTLRTTTAPEIDAALFAVVGSPDPRQAAAEITGSAELH